MFTHLLPFSGQTTRTSATCRCLSQRLGRVSVGHASPGLTLNTYAHLFSNTDDKAAAVIDALAK